MGAGAVDAGVCRLFSWPGVVGVAALLALSIGVRWLAAGRVPTDLELALAFACVALMAAPTWSIRRGRARSAAAATAELARKQAMFRSELEQRLEVQGHLRESEARVRAIVDTAPIVLFAIDRDCALTFSAGVVPEPLGKKPGEAIGWSATDLFNDHPDVVDGIRNALSGIGGRADLFQSERSFSFNLAPFRDSAGSTAGAIVVAIDVTERRRTEEALRQTVATLQEGDQNRQGLLRPLVPPPGKGLRASAPGIPHHTNPSLFAVGLHLSTLRK